MPGADVQRKACSPWLRSAVGTIFNAKTLGVGSLFLFLLVAAAAGVEANLATLQAGFDDRVLTNSHGARTIPIALWYPTASTETRLPYSRAQTGQAARGAPIAPGRWPLVIVSHGSGGNRFNQSALGEALARNGFIVAAFEHQGDRTFDDGASGTAGNLFHRPQDVRFVLDALLGENGRLADAIDRERIAMIGHSVGGFTATVVGGGRPSLASLETYCRTNANSDPDARLRAAILMAPAIGLLFNIQPVGSCRGLDTCVVVLGG